MVGHLGDREREVFGCNEESRWQLLTQKADPREPMGLPLSNYQLAYFFFYYPAGTSHSLEKYERL